MRLTITLIVLLTFSFCFSQSRKTQEKRFDFLMSNYFNQKIDKDILGIVNSTEEINCDVNKSFQTLVSEDRTKFIVFFLEQFNPKNLSTFRESKKDKSVNILTTKDIMQGGGFDDINTYAFIVCGVMHENQWFLEKNKVTYFAASSMKYGQEYFFNQLQDWGFFKSNSTQLNVDFWATGLFRKIASNLANDPNWSAYLGLYSIVANKMIADVKAQVIKKEQAILSSYIDPLIDKLKAQNDYELVLLKHMSREYILIYPVDFKVVMCPIKVKEKDKEMYLRYFVLLADGDDYKVYEWTYLDQSSFRNTNSAPSFMDQINTLTVWNYSFQRLDDSKFWSDYVLTNVEGQYKYLVEFN